MMLKLLILLSFFSFSKAVYADSVGQAQVTKFFAPETVQMLLNRTGSATPGIQQGDTLTYIIESIPVNDGGNQGVNGYITDYIPKGLEVVGASFVGKVPNPTLPGGFDYVDRPLNSAGLMQQGTGKRNVAFIAPFSAGGLPEGSQDTGIFYSTDPRTARTPLGIDVTACTGAGFAAPLLVYNQWDIDQFNAFGNGGGCITLPVGPTLSSGGQGTHPLITLGLQLKGLGSPVSGPETYYTNDYNPGLLVPSTCIPPVGALPAALPYACAGPWKRISYPGSMMGGQGPITAYLAGGAATAPVSTAVPTSIGEFLSPAGGNPNLPWAATIPATRVNAVRWAFGQRVVGTIERVKISFKVRDFLAFSTPAPAGAGFQNHSSVFGGDITAPAAGKDLTYKYLGPTQSISDARLMLIKQVVAVGVPSLINPAIINWTPSDGATVSPGQFVKYRITYLNATSRSLVGFSIVDQLDVLPNIISGVVNVAYVVGTATTGVPYLALPVAGAGTVSWTPVLPQSTLVPGGGGYVELVVQVLPGAGLGDTTTNTAHGLSTLPVLSVFSYAPSNITTVAPARLTNSKTVSPASAIPGQNVKYNIVVSNTGGPLVGPILGGAAAGGPSVYPAGGDIVIGDKLDPNLLIAPNTLATPITVSLRDKTTGLIYPYPAATALPTVLVQPPIAPALVGTSVAYWTITGYPLTYPAPVPLPVAANYLSNVDFLIDFYATVQLPTAPGTYFNGLESYAADAVNGVDLNWVTSGLAPLTVSAAGSTLFPNISFKKTATAVNGPVLLPVLNPGDDILYNFTITNAVAPSPLASTVVVTDPVPPGTKFVIGSVTALGATVSYSNNGGLTYLYPPVGLAGVIDPYVTHVRLTYPSLAAGATLSPSFKVRTLSTLQNGFVVSNQATLNALSGVTPFSLTSDDDPLLAPNPNPTTINISALSNFTTSAKTVLGNTGGGLNVQPADVLTYAITVTNSGFSASNVRVVDTLNLTQLSFGAHVALPANWSVIGPDANGLITWNVANMPAASTATLTFTATVNALAKGAVVDNTAVISSDQSSPITVNAPTLTVPAPRVSGVVFSDTNGNAIQDAGEVGVANVTVALRALGSTVDTVSVVTNASGAYVLTAPLAGDWYAQVTDLSGVLTGFSATTNNPLVVTLIDGVTLNNQNFGYTLATLPASVKGRIFDDVDANGIQNGTEVGYGLVTLELQTATGVVLASTVTDVLGDYVFANVAAGDYRLVVSDTSSVLFNRYLTTGLSSPVALTNLLADSISTVNFGYALGSQVGDIVFDDANNNGIQDIGETGIPGIVLTLTKGGVTVATATTDNAGAYLFTAIPPSNIANDYTLSLVVPIGFTASTALVSPILLTVVSGVNDLTKDFGFNALPNLLVTKTSASPTANFSSSAEYTITVTNTGGAAANFSVADILPTATPPLSVGGALPYTPSPSSFLYFSTTSVLLNGLPYTAPVLPLVQFVTQPKWSGFTMPAASTLTITFTAFTGALEGVHHNGVRLSYNNSAGALLPQTVLDFPDLASVTLSTTGVLSKAVTAVNGVAPVAGIEPTVTVGDNVTYTVTLSNSPAAVAQQLKSVTETMPLGFTYILNSTLITAPLNQPAAAPLINPTVVGQVLTWTMPALTPPTTLALNPLSTITLSFNLLVGSAAVQGSQTDVATAGVIVGLNPVLTLSTGNTAPVTLLKPLLSMTKTTSTPLITKDALGQYAPASYTISVLNAGLVNANAVTLTDTLPLGFTFGTGAALINGVPVAASFTQAGQVLTVTTNPVGGFVVPANNGVSDGRLTINYTATIAPANLPNVYTNTVALTSANANPISGVSAAVELSGIQLSKTTSTPNIGPGGVARYTVTVTNNGGVALLNATISDILPTGFNYQLGSTLINGAASADPAGTLATPQWLLTSVAANSSLTISFNVDVDPLITPQIYYNTIQGHNVSGQTFPNPGPTAPVTIVPPTPTLTILKSASAATATPGSTIIYTVSITNTGSGQANTVVITDKMSPYTKLALVPFPAPNTTMFSFVDVNLSGLPGTATVTYSNDGGATYNYVPVDDGTGHDPAITNFKLLMNGTMNANQTANPSFRVQYQVQVK